MKKRSLTADILNSVTKYFLILAAVVVVAIALSGIKVVKSGNVAIILRFGKLVGNTYEEQVHEPGLMFAFPYIIDEVVMVPTGTVMEQTVTTHYTNGNMTTLRNNGYVITGDQNIAIISASVKYAISDPVAYALNVKNVQELINAFVSSAMVDEAARLDVDSLLTNGKDKYAENVMNLAQAKLSLQESGIMLVTVELTNVSMPYEVKDIYEMVTAANVNAATLLEQAKQYRENLIPGAQAEANTLIANANSSYASAVAAANSELSEFRGVLEEYLTNPDVVKARLYSDKISKAISNIGTVRVVQDGETNIIISGDK